MLTTAIVGETIYVSNRKGREKSLRTGALGRQFVR
jgi:hypothetical protein